MIRSLCIAVLILLAVSATAQERWSWPDSLENMQELPADWTGERLRPVMTGFARALGVRCSHCHVGEPGAPLSTYDFVSDDNPNKERTREMLRLLGSVNDHLQKLEPSGDQRVNMWCHTCHRGRPRPMTLAEELGETYQGEGLDAALAQHGDLKERYFGRGVYDFMSDRTLNGLGYAALGADDVDGALRAFQLNVEAFPESANAWDSLGEAHMKAGDQDEAVACYRRSLELNPDNSNAVEMLRSMGATD